MVKNPKAAFAAGVVCALVLGGGTAYAANGGNLVLGQGNKAGRVTSLTNTKGTALSLKSKAGKPALTVSNSVKIPKLNADQLDGTDSKSFALTSGKTAYISSSAVAYDQDSNGVAETFVAVATCPRGTKFTGGGDENFTNTGFTYADEPAGGNAWGVLVFTDNSTTEDPTNVVASVVCYNPRGGVSGGTTRIVTKTTPGSIPSYLTRRMTQLIGSIK